MEFLTHFIVFSKCQSSKIRFNSAKERMTSPTFMIISDSCRELTFPSFLFFAGKRLLNHTIKTLQVRDLDECELQCYYKHDCVSINFNNEAGKTDEKHTCELNNYSTHDLKEQDLVEVKHYFYRGTKVRS